MIRTIPTLHGSALAVSALVIAAAALAWHEARHGCHNHLAPSHTITRAAS